MSPNDSHTSNSSQSHFQNGEEGQFSQGHQNEGHQGLLKEVTIEIHQTDSSGIGMGFQNGGHSTSEGHPNDGHISEGHENEGRGSEGHQNESHISEGHKNEGHSSESHPHQGYGSEGHRNEGHDFEGHENEGNPFKAYLKEGHTYEGHQGLLKQGQVHKSPESSDESDNKITITTLRKSLFTSCKTEIQTEIQSESSKLSSLDILPLDAMLSDLRSDLANAGVRTSPTGMCAKCNKAIQGQVVTAMGKTWHLEVS